MEHSQNPQNLSFLLENLKEVKEKVANASSQSLDVKDVRLVAVSKTKPADFIKYLFENGQTHFGENYVDEFVEKQEVLDKNIKWHFIGHLQTNKIPKILESNIDVLETVDSEKLAEKIHKGVIARNLKPLKVFIQVKMSGEESKHGLVGEESVIRLANRIKLEFTGLELKGLMCIGQEGDKSVFTQLSVLRDKVALELGVEKSSLELSMGMSADFEEAVSQKKAVYNYSDCWRKHKRKSRIQHIRSQIISIEKLRVELGLIKIC